ncbi:MAG: hypothetical protein A2Z69_02305 [Bacteroidetes bacterium RBG_13_44_24]|nr:MAG: hypothetical protein A2Z69_02305 [Bacteroidetes bacterium RBG_13_44_24]
MTTIDERNAKARLRYAENKDSEHIKQKAWRAKHKEQEKQRWKIYHILNKDKINAKQRERRAWNKDNIRAKRREWYHANKAELQVKMKKNRIALRAEILRHYGSKCACCGETEPKFLALDHINGGGYRHRKNIGQDGHSLYHWIRKNDYPAGFQLLCHNCNMAKGLYGECPHKTGERRE